MKYASQGHSSVATYAYMYTLGLAIYQKLNLHSIWIMQEIISELGPRLNSLSHFLNNIDDSLNDEDKCSQSSYF